MKNEMDFYDHCNKFEYNHDYLKLMKHSYVYISKFIKNDYTDMCESILTLSIS